MSSELTDIITPASMGVPDLFHGVRLKTGFQVAMKLHFRKFFAINHHGILSIFIRIFNILIAAQAGFVTLLSTKGTEFKSVPGYRDINARDHCHHF